MYPQRVLHKEGRIAQLPGNATYRQAAERAARLGGLSSAALFESSIGCKSTQGPLWFRQIIAHPASGGKFGYGDMEDHGTGWVLLSEYTKEVRGHARVALTLDSVTFEDRGDGKTNLHPKTIRVLERFPQESGMGVLNQKTGMVEEPPQASAAKIQFWRASTQAIRPVLLDFGMPQDFIVGCLPTREFGISYTIFSEERDAKDNSGPAATASGRQAVKGPCVLITTIGAQRVAQGEKLVSDARRELRHAVVGIGNVDLPALNRFVGSLSAEGGKGIVARGIAHSEMGLLVSLMRNELEYITTMGYPYTRMEQLVYMVNFASLMYGSIPTHK
jgi:hypothetical protein